MTVSTQLTKITYQGNGVTTSFGFTFPGGPDPDISVFLTDSLGNISQLQTNYQVNVNPPVDPNPTSVGGTVLYPISGSPLPLGNTITIARQVPITQPTSFVNQGTIYQQTIETSIDFVVEQVQQVEEQLARTISVPITDPNVPFLPSAALRAGKLLGFDTSGNPIVTGSLNQIASSNAVRAPTNETIPALPPANQRGGFFLSFDGSGNPILVSTLPPNINPLFGPRIVIVGTHTVLNTEKGSVLELSGNTLFDLNFGDPTTYDVDFSVAVVNTDAYTGPGTGRARRILFNGVLMPGAFLWPGQWIYVFRFGSTWITNPSLLRWRPNGPVTINIDPVVGHDDLSADGLAAGSQGAFKTIGKAIAVGLAQIDPGGFPGLTFQLATGTYVEAINISSGEIGFPLTIMGAPDGSDPAPYTIQVPANSVGIFLDNASEVFVHGIQFTGGGTNAWGIGCARGSVISIINCKFGPFIGTSAVMMHIYDGSVATISGVSILGNCVSPLVVRSQSVARVAGNWFTQPGITFGSFFQAYFHSTIVGGNTNIALDATNFTMGGGAGCIGAKYRIMRNSVLDLGTGSYADTGLPGNQVGIVGSSDVLHGADASTVYGT